MELGNTILILVLLPVYGFGIALHLDLIDSGDMFHIEELIQNIDLQSQSDSLFSNAFMSSDVEGGIIEHAYIDLGLKNVLVDPNEIPNSGDEYFDNLINECSFHSDDSIEGNVCVECKLLDEHLRFPCIDFWIDFDGVGNGEHQDNASHQDVIDYLKDNFGITLSVDFRNDNDPTDDEVTTYNSNRDGNFNDGDCDFDIQHEFQPGDDPSIGNLLIMREDQGTGSSCQPNDRGAGGILIFELDKPMFLESIDVVDHDNQPNNAEDSKINAYQTSDCTGMPSATADIEKFDFEKSLQKVVINAENVSCFEIIYPDSGGFTNIHLRCIPCLGAWIDFAELDHDASHQDVLDYLDNLGITLSVDFRNDDNPSNDEVTIYDSNIFGFDALPPNPGLPLNDCDFDLEHELIPDDPNVKKLLIMREVGANCQPNDRGAGGTLTFELATPMFLESIDVVDHDNQPSGAENSKINAYQTSDCSGTPIVTKDIVKFNQERVLQRIFLNANNVSCFEIIYPDSGGFTNIHLTCVEDGIKEKINPEDVIASGLRELDGYTGSDKVIIPFDEPVDVQDAVAIAIKVFRNQIADPTGLFLGDVIIADDNRDAIIRVDLATGLQTIISNDQDNRWDDPENLLIDSQGRLLVADGDKPGSSGPGTIFIVDPADGTLSVFTTGGFFKDGPEDLVEDALGNIYVLDDSADISADGRIIKVTPGGVQSLLTTFGSSFFNSGKVEGITIDNNGDLIVVGGKGSSAKVIKVDPDTGDKTVISDSSDGDKFLRPEGVAVAANGDIFVADGNPSDSNNVNTRGQIVKVNPGNGAQTVIISTTNPNGPDWVNGQPWVDPSDVEIIPLGVPTIGGFLLVIDDAADDDGSAGMGALIMVNPANGDTEIITANGFFDSPEGLFIVKTVPPSSQCVPKVPPEEECPECEKPHFFTVRYDNSLHPDEVVTIEVFKKSSDFPGTPLTVFNGVMDGDDNITIDGSDFNKNGKVNSDTAYCILFDSILDADTFSPSSGGQPRVSNTCVQIHTSCSQDLFVGDVHLGDFGVSITVVSGTDENFNPTIPDLSCKE